MNQQKRCKDCQEVKGAAEFHLSSKGGLRARCKPCMNAYNRAHSKGTDYRSEEYRAFNRDRKRRYVVGSGKEVTYRLSRRYVATHPERKRAWAAVSRAVAKGTLVRPELCACGRPGLVEAHHDDYSKPLDVLWLCTVCHKARHEWLKGQAAA